MAEIYIIKKRGAIVSLAFDLELVKKYKEKVDPSVVIATYNLIKEHNFLTEAIDIAEDDEKFDGVKVYDHSKDWK